ncbi:MAG: SDR family NAD(P)-dependent oxidoreductase [Jiangellales bacterium]
MNVRGKVWVVSGAGSGMGRELVLALLSRGARVAGVDVRAEGLDETARLAAAGDRFSVHVVDITDVEGVAALVDDVLAAHEVVDGLINNAGIIQPFVPVAELSDAALHRVLDVNLVGTITMTRAFLPVLMGRPQAHLANVSSMGGFFPFPGQTMYGASKAAVKLFTEGLYAEMIGSPLQVSVIMPGAVATSISENSGVGAPGGEAAQSSRIPQTQPDVAARIMIEGIEKNKLHIYVGNDARLMSVAIKLAPRRAIHVVQKQMSKMLALSEPATRQ